MCILFAYINNEATDGEFQVIIASNRDELYDRPTAPAARWQDNPACISGVDIKPDVPAGGTWLGLSTETRKIATLLNISQLGHVDPNLKGRGCLVTKFITSDVAGEQYLSGLKQHAEEYNPFNLLTMEQNEEKGWKVQYYSSRDAESPYYVTDNVIGLSNSTYRNPWKKVQRGKKEFSDIVTKNGKKENKDELVKQLIALLGDKTSTLPDPHLEQNAPTPINVTLEEHNRARSCINVDLPKSRYGSRTNTVILIDGEGEGHYVERTMVEPIDEKNPQWSTSSIRFKMGETL